MALDPVASGGTSDLGRIIRAFAKRKWHLVRIEPGCHDVYLVGTTLVFFI